MDKREAEALYDSGKKPTVNKLLDQDRQIKTLNEKIASLSADSTNSSKPPSSDGPRVERKKKKRSLRGPGAQKGHKGHKRQLLPVEQMNHVYDYYPKSCDKCHKTLDPHSHQEPSEPLRHQTFELPVMEPIKTEYRLHALQCTMHLRLCKPRSLPPVSFQE